MSCMDRTGYGADVISAQKNERRHMPDAQM